MRQLFMSMALLAGFFLLAACTHTPLHSKEARPTETQNQDRYQVRIPIPGGQFVQATVYQPELQPGQTAPIIIASLGKPRLRAKLPMVSDGQSILVNRAAMAAWENGYWVVSYHQPDLAHPPAHLDRIIVNLGAVIDWSVATLPRIKRLISGQPAMGMIGEGHSAALQTLAAFSETRLQALVPISGWHDIHHTLDVFDDASNRQQRLLYQHSPAALCEQAQTPHADALFIQGFSDADYPFQQAEKNVNCWRKQGRDARLIGLQSVDTASGLPFLHNDSRVHCGDYHETTVDTILSWWDEKLEQGVQRVPQYCINVTEDRGIAVEEELPNNRTKYILPHSTVTLPLAGAFEWFMTGVDTGTDLLRAMWPGVDLRDLKANGGFGRPRFVPMHIARGDDEILLGKPRIEVSLGGISGKKSMPVFIGVGIQHANQRRVRVASQQLTPLPEKGIYSLELPAVSEPLQAGDRVGLVMYGFTAQHPFNAALLVRSASIKGAAWLPLTREEVISLEAERSF